jgi:hypothetical protein
MEIDLHGYHPSDIVWNGVLARIVQQAWEMGERRLCLIHGHGRNRGITPGFVNTNTGFFGLQIRRTLRHEKELRKWIHHTTLCCDNPGTTSVVLRCNLCLANCYGEPILPVIALRKLSLTFGTQPVTVKRPDLRSTLRWRNTE